MVPLGVLLALALSLVSILGFLYNVKLHYPGGIWLLPIVYAILLEFAWHWNDAYFHGRLGNVLSWGSLGLVVLMLPIFYPRVAAADNQLDMATRWTVQVARDRLIGFSALVSILGWSFWLLYTHLNPDRIPRFDVLPFHALTYLAPMLAVWVYARAQQATGDLSRIWHELSHWRVSLPDWGWAALGPFALGVTVNIVLSKEPVSFPHGDTLLYGVLISLAIGVGREVVWRGYALTEAVRRWNPLLAAFVIGVIWTVFHRVMDLANPSYSETFTLQQFPMMVGFSVYFAGFYRRTAEPAAVKKAV